MKIYDEITNEELTSPDLSAGYLYTARRVAEHVPESREVMQGTVTEDDPKGLEHIISGYDVYEDCQFYHAYTAEELAEREKPTLQEQVDANAAATTAVAQLGTDRAAETVESITANLDDWWTYAEAWEEQPPMTLNQRMDAVETALADIVDIMTGGAEA